MYIVNTIKRVILYGNELFRHKEQNNTLKYEDDGPVFTEKQL